MTMSPNHALQRFGVAGETRRRIMLHSMKHNAEGRVCWAARESTDTRRARRGCNRDVPCAGSLSLGR
jgi:hypothetical protein